KRLDGRLYTTDDEDDSGDELCCFKVTESVRQKSLVTMSTYHKKKRAEHAFSMLSSGTISIADDQSVGSSVQSRLTSGQTLSLPIGKNYRLKDNVVKVRLEFLADLAAYMNARTTAQLTKSMIPVARSFRFRSRKLVTEDSGRRIQVIPSRGPPPQTAGA
ncbi:hypothetical protein X801_07680, partial [Opisthorchis viverrini]